MQTDPPTGENARRHGLPDTESPIEALNARIARLAIALGVSLNSDDEVSRLMSQSSVVAVQNERRGAPERRLSSRSGAGAERRQSYLRDELRGLLVLRYEVEKRYVDEAGVTVTRQIMVEAEEHLLRRGFKSGADGVDVNRLFDKL